MHSHRASQQRGAKPCNLTKISISISPSSFRNSLPRLTYHPTCHQSKLLYIRFPTPSSYPYAMPSTLLYQPLDTSKPQIRLIHITPGKGDDPIHCKFVVAELEEYGGQSSLKYDALSYEWGSQLSQREIVVDGIPLMVGANLWNALHELREPRPTRLITYKLSTPIWIDAICINQQELMERNFQVGMMDMIYRNADCVRVWLGPEDMHSNKAINLLRKIGVVIRAVEHHVTIEERFGTGDETAYRHFIFPVERRLELHKYFPTYSETATDYTTSIKYWKQQWEKLLCADDEEWSALARLLNRTYWSRIWIVQEFVLPQRKILHCGTDILDTTDIEIGLDQISTTDARKYPKTRDSICRIQTSPGTLIIKYAAPWLREHRSLVEIISMCKSSKASEPHDKIYAILGLAHDIWHLDIQVDYSKPISELKFEVLRSYVSLNQHSGCYEPMKLWVLLNETLPESLSACEQSQHERTALKIISEVRPPSPRLQAMIDFLKQIVSIVAYI